MTTQTLDIGRLIEAVPRIRGDRDDWRAECPSLTSDWSCRLSHRGEGNILPDMPLMAWILDVDSDRKFLHLSSSNFGFLPISDRMRPRYIAALRRVMDALRANDPRKATPNDYSEVKGMFSRCSRRDQWDWYAVHLALGKPNRSHAKGLAAALGDIGKALRMGNQAEARTLLDHLNCDEFRQVLSDAIESISSGGKRIPRARAIQKKAARRLNNDAKENERKVLSSYSKDKLDIANLTHSGLLDTLTEHLGSYGHQIEANQFVDAFTRLKSGPAIFEAKSITDDNEVSQIRYGLSQLYEYRFRHNLRDASLWLLLSRHPKTSWLVDYLEQDRQVRVLWIENGQLAGPSYERLLESGSDVLRRNQGFDE